ncbi:MAG: polysaccharide biosynthesis tyrosine autokinase [Oligoflexia bacterium]|nr:polysaccharide biosynthesis tyrosine autokinase [Oligoflexia bacterium]
MTQNLPSQAAKRGLPGLLDPNLGMPSGLPTESEESEVTLRELLRIVMKYRKLIGSAVALGLIVSLIYAFTASPIYSAHSTIRIGTYDPVLPVTKVEDLLQQKSKETTYFETQLAEIKSLSLADEVLTDRGLKNDLFPKTAPSFFMRLFGRGESSDKDPLKEVVPGYHSTLRQLQKYLGLLEIEPVRRTALVNITAHTRSPKLAAEIANRHANAYIDWVRKSRVDQQSRALVFLNQQAVELREKTADLERQMADYAEANQIVALNKDENVTVQKMAQLNELLTSTTGKRIEAENLYREAERSLTSPSAGFDDPSTQSMRSELAKLEAEYGQLSSKFTSSYPRMQQLSAQISGLKRSIEAQRSQVVLGLKAKSQALVEEERHLAEELERQKSEAFELSKSQVQFNVLKRELTTSREMLQNVLKQTKETALAVESNASNVSVVDLAAPPLTPSFPNKRLIVLAGILSGAIFGMGLAFLLSHLDNTIRTPLHISQRLGLNCLGVVPSFDPDAVSSPGQGEQLALAAGESAMAPAPANERPNPFLPTPLVYMSSPKSLAAEAYRTVRTGLLLSQAGGPPKTILLTSAQASEGKTTTAMNLAASLASAGGRVALVDADLRRPSVLKYWKLDRTLPGLVDVITGQKQLSEVLIETSMKRIVILPSGETPPNPAELLGSVEMASVMDQLAAEYDYVIIDSPPILPVTDSVVLSRFVDGVVMVVKSSSTPKSLVVDAKKRLAAVGARLLGVVLNDANIKGGDYYYYNRYYYSYYTAPDQHKTASSG